jgi:HEPN domain-containing protein
MQPEMAAEVREWLERAADDLREAEHDLTAVQPLVRGAVFHCQQAAEKAL